MQSRRLIRFGAAWLLAAWVIPGVMAAPPPERLHYQGRLTTSGGAPITTAQTLYFSLWRDGSAGGATTANSGTEFYRESATVTPDGNGIFEHQVGSGTPEGGLGSLDPAKFNTPEPVYLQVAVGTLGNVLLPRTRIVSVGYAFVAGTALSAPFAGAAQVTSVTDVTGGLTVVGDLLRVSGSGLSDAVVLVGGKRARVKSQSASEIVCQVPAGVPRGLNAITVVEDDDLAPSHTGHYVYVTRLVVGVIATTSGADRICVINPETGALLANIDPSPDIDSDDGPIQFDFAHEGALALVPDNDAGFVIAVDLTLPTPDDIDTNDYGGTPKSIAVSPDYGAIVLSEYGNNNLRRITLNESFPPYSSSLLGGSSLLGEPSGGNTISPRGATWIGNSLLLVLSTNRDSILGYRRRPGTTDFDDDNAELVLNETPIGTDPLTIRSTPDQSRVVVTFDDGDLAAFYVTPNGVTAVVTPPAAIGGADALHAAIAPDGRTVMVGNAAAAPDGEIRVFDLTGDNLTLTGRFIYADYENEDDGVIQSIAIDPVDGDLAAVTLDDGRIRIYERVGGSLGFLRQVNLGINNTSTLDIRFQP